MAKAILPPQAVKIRLRYLYWRIAACLTLLPPGSPVPIKPSPSLEVTRVAMR
ncbi:hypothetical protein I307_05282 [Cryptococcus deuterogattii 99/473]|uniref:Uncharacterized protein n=1 Tax=Cryptococcus deuterogattii Ram5 TaxID=1296110 RepID=A0A0D0URD3_9TREE|nr:hypothetical protein I309_04921 [Cryptococcus deuterogattii LA55]KIR37761.1 hypothetical protein I313_06489 [Cryptococcus deuterogattii Ram5]KIR89675.1 hypothetical protein I304_06560 [Cryptococcus deuterogattii CBS 10090]KIR96541.1 hypothetical protein L804_06022 [Cryptococcus deuterogattii 2001/935-1]KIY55392.1 hypothetical protein I307_05282 [Cryptococcus deuterogattii 99/473]